MKQSISIKLSYTLWNKPREFIQVESPQQQVPFQARDVYNVDRWRPAIWATFSSTIGDVAVIDPYTRPIDLKDAIRAFVQMWSVRPWSHTADPEPRLPPMPNEYTSYALDFRQLPLQSNEIREYLAKEHELDPVANGDTILGTADSCWEIALKAWRMATLQRGPTRTVLCWALVIKGKNGPWKISMQTPKDYEIRGGKLCRVVQSA